MVAFGLVLVAALGGTLDWQSQPYNCSGEGSVSIEAARLGGEMKEVRSGMNGKEEISIPLRRVTDPAVFITFCDVTLAIVDGTCKNDSTVVPFEAGSKMQVRSDGAGGFALNLKTGERQQSIPVSPSYVTSSKGKEIGWLQGSLADGMYYVFFYDMKLSDNNMPKSYRLEFYAQNCEKDARPGDKNVIQDGKKGDQPISDLAKVPRTRQAPVGSGNEPPAR